MLGKRERSNTKCRQLRQSDRSSSYGTSDGLSLELQ